MTGDAMTELTLDPGERHRSPDYVLVHFPSDETGMIPGDCWCLPEMAKRIQQGRANKAKVAKQNRARLGRARFRYRENPTPRRRKALLDAIGAICGLCSSHIRTDNLVYSAIHEPAEIWWPAFLSEWTSCDAGAWKWSTVLLDKFRRLRDARQSAIPYLDPKDKEFYDSLPDLIEVWRGADRRTARCFSWTTDKATAEFFAVHRRGAPFDNPVIAQALIRKADIFVAINGRSENEIILDPRRLRRLAIEDVSQIESGKPRDARAKREAT